MHRLKLLLLSPTLLLMGLLVSTPAIAQYYPGYPDYPGQPGHPSYPAPQHPRTTVETANIQSYLDRNKRIDLARALRLSSILTQGRELRAITVRGSSSMSARLTLTHNGRLVDSVAMDYHTSERQLRIPSLVRATDQLVLTVSSTAFIASVSAIIEERGYAPVPPTPAPPMSGNIFISIDRPVAGLADFSLLDRARAQTQGRVSGMRIQRVVLTAQSMNRYRLAQAQLIINGQPHGMVKTLPLTAQNVAFELPSYAMNVVDQDLRSVRIKITGDARAISAQLHGASAPTRPAPPPRPPRW